MPNLLNARYFQQSLRKIPDNVCVAIKKCILKTYYPAAEVVYQNFDFWLLQRISDFQLEAAGVAFSDTNLHSRWILGFLFPFNIGPIMNYTIFRSILLSRYNFWKFEDSFSLQNQDFLL